MQSTSSHIRNIPGVQSKNANNENNDKAEELRRRRQRRRRRRPISSTSTSTTNTNINSNFNSHFEITSSSCRLNDNNHHEFSSSSLTSWIDDPFRMIAAAVEHDENKRNALEVLQVPLETGRLYHNQKLFFRALSHLRKENRSYRFGWSMLFQPSNLWNASSNRNDHDGTKETIVHKHKEEAQDESKLTKIQEGSTQNSALTPIILSGLLASLDVSNFSNQEQCANPNCNNNRCANARNQDVISTRTAKTSAVSTELVNYTVGMRRAAQARVRLRLKRKRIQRIVKPILAVVTTICLYIYAWSSVQRLLVGFYGITLISFAPPGNGNENAIEVRLEVPRLITSSCRSRSNAVHFGYLSDYAKACRISEATTFEILTSTHNSHHTKLFSRTAHDELDVEPVQNAYTIFNNHDDKSKLSASLMQYDNDYGDDTELPFYAMHTALDDSESSIIPLVDVIHGRQQERDKIQRQRWRRRRRRQQKYKQLLQRANGFDDHNRENVSAALVRLSQAVQFWGDTTVNYLVRKAIVEAHYKISSSSTKSVKASSNGDDRKSKLKILDVGSGLSGTLFSLCTPDFPFEDWSYHGIAISQPEVRRAKQLVDSVVRPIITSSSAKAQTPESVDPSIDGHDDGTSPSFPITNITIEQASFDDSLLRNEYTTMIAIESLAFSHNITRTLINLAKSLKPKGTLIIVEDVLAPWVAPSNKIGSGNPDTEYTQNMINFSGKPSLLTHEKWLESFAAAGLTLLRPARDLMFEFDASSMGISNSAATSTVTGIPFGDLLIGEQPWYAKGRSVLRSLIDYFGGHHEDGSVKDDDGNLLNRALSLMEDLIENEQGKANRRVAHRRGDLSYYMYVCKKN